MAWLPDAHDRTVRLNLIHIPPFDPDALRLLDGLLNHDGLLNDHWLLNDRGCRHDCRSGLNDYRVRVAGASQCRTDHTADHTADETRPEIAATRTPITAVMVVIVVARSTMPTMVRAAMPTMGECTERDRNHRNR